MRYRAGFAYVDALLADGEELRLCRLRDTGSASQWGFAIYRAGHDDYEDSHRHHERHRRTRPRHRLRPLPQLPHRLDLNPDELAEMTISARGSLLRTGIPERSGALSANVRGETVRPRYGLAAGVRNGRARVVLKGSEPRIPAAHRSRSA